LASVLTTIVETPSEFSNLLIAEFWYGDRAKEQFASPRSDKVACSRSTLDCHDQAAVKDGHEKAKAKQK